MPSENLGRSVCLWLTENKHTLQSNYLISFHWNTFFCLHIDVSLLTINSMQWTSSQQIVRLILDLTVFKSSVDDWSEKTLFQVSSPQAIAGRNNKNEYLVGFRISPFSYFVIIHGLSL